MPLLPKRWAGILESDLAAREIQSKGLESAMMVKVGRELTLQVQYGMMTGAIDFDRGRYIMSPWSEISSWWCFKTGHKILSFADAVFDFFPRLRPTDIYCQWTLLTNIIFDGVSI